jgi:hypothetical protein
VEPVTMASKKPNGRMMVPDDIALFVLAEVHRTF